MNQNLWKSLTRSGKSVQMNEEMLNYNQRVSVIEDCISNKERIIL